MQLNKKKGLEDPALQQILRVSVEPGLFNFYATRLGRHVRPENPYNRGEWGLAGPRFFGNV